RGQEGRATLECTSIRSARQADRPRCPRQPATRSGPAALRPRPRRYRLAHRGGTQLRGQQASPRSPRFSRRRAYPQRDIRQPHSHPRRPVRRGRAGTREHHHLRHARQRRRPHHLGRLLALAEPRHRARLRHPRPRGAGHPAPGRGARATAARHRRRAPLRFPPLRPEGHRMTTRFTDDHEYIRVDGATGTVGITNHAQDQLGDIVFVELPSVGQKLKKGDEAAVVESVKAASEIYSPASGTVIEVNSVLASEPGLINSSADADGWIYKLRLDNAAELDSLMDDAAYKKHTA